jgi:hypothetical protein
VLEVNVSIAIPEPPAMLAGLIVVVSPAVPEVESETIPEKWFNGVIVMLDEPLLPALISILATLAVIA